jgi:hypothetical protein
MVRTVKTFTLGFNNNNPETNNDNVRSYLEILRTIVMYFTIMFGELPWDKDQRIISVHVTKNTGSAPLAIGEYMF